jgi:spermidine/putrescine-binding protein
VHLCPLIALFHRASLLVRVETGVYSSVPQACKTVKMTMFSSNEEMILKFKAGGLSQYDVMVPSCYAVKSMIAQNLI